MVGLIQKCKSAIPSKIKRLCSKIKPDRRKHYLLVRCNDEFNYKLIKYIWWKNFHVKVKNAQLEKNHSSVKSNYNTYTEQLCWIQTTKFKDNEKLRNTLLKKIATQPKKKYINKSLETLNVYGMLCCKYQHLLDDDQQNSVSDCIKQNLEVILSQGKLEKTKITGQKANKLISENEKVLEKIGKVEVKNENYQSKSDLWIREIIFEEIKRYIGMLKNKQIDQKMQQTQQEVNELRSEALELIDKVETRGQPLEVLLEKTENLKEAAEEFFSNTKRIKHKYKTANSKTFYYALAVAVAIAVTTLICYCIYTTFSKPNQSLDNVTLTQNVEKLINSIT
ncbi:MAG: hypothetical protein sL5_06440 [Candidatus Mesenet longicola]|uniref:V-SNARE coiled-coil homology domain-containing protein n=1 Tax=Candidatus Mesenet longicola TaxID=1892558 RepID=A0A8J3HWN6_9RICK|nr:MAG: hypothetical protein sGL2_06450 [Candidatus Mesenet longicola]GHM59651.1 MAG: hypothetical protein sL5_06440 [Candidatus Mesenet longicola]